jgi:hypothetical protein
VVAPLVSAATRFIPSASPISVLQGPSASGDQSAQAVQPTRALPMTQALQSVQAQQPVQAAASLLGGVLQNTAAQGAMTQGPANQSPIAQGVQALAGQGPVMQNPAVQSEIAQGAQSIASALPSVFGGGGPTSGSGPAAAPDAPSSSRAEDPAALDTLARQLYGRFSRHLAGELLIDRERSQFLTDLG